MDNLSQIIADSISDAEIPIPAALETVEDDAPVEVEPTPTEPLEASPEATEELTEPVSMDPKSPAEKAMEAPVLDEFDKKYGLAPNSSSGRENRIPYSRVKKIADNNAKEAVTKAKDSWTKDLETTHIPKAQYAELETKFKDYESRLQGVAQYEDMLLNRPVEFLKKLVELPQYAQIFNQPAPADQKTATPTEADPMPQPDQDNGDGTFTYSMKGLENLLEWKSRQVEDRMTKKFDTQYKPLYDDYQRHQQVQQVLPGVQRQIEDARTWKLFNENEAEIVSVLEKYPDASLERAYQHVVWPKLQAEIDAAKAEQGKLKESYKVDEAKVRAKVLAELKQAPRSTSAATTGVKGGAVTEGPRSIEDVIAESIKGLK